MVHKRCFISNCSTKYESSALTATPLGRAFLPSDRVQRHQTSEEPNNQTTDLANESTGHAFNDFSNKWPPASIFIKRLDGKTFKEMSSREIKEIITSLEEQMGLFAPGGVSIAAGGDLFIRTLDQEQHNSLKDVKTVGSNIKVICSSSRSLGTTKVVIKGVPLGDSDDDMLDELQSKYPVTCAICIRRGPKKTATPTVILEFNTVSPPKEVNHLIFRCQPYIPHHMRCINCNKFGHTKNVCRDIRRCKNCGPPRGEEDSWLGPTRCINCNGEHSANATFFPTFIKLKETAKLAIEKGMSLHEARSHLSYNAAAKKSMPNPTQPAPAEIEIL